MKCPQCGSGLVSVQFQTISVDKCPVCRGAWFDSGELSALVQEIKRGELRVEESEATAPTLGPNLCPRCFESLLPFDYQYNANIRLKRCPACKGIWVPFHCFGAIKKLYQSSRKVFQRDAGFAQGLKEHYEDIENWQTIGEFSSLLSSRVPIWLLFAPKIVMPLSDSPGVSSAPLVTLSLIGINLVLSFYHWTGLSGMKFEQYVNLYGMVPARVIQGDRLPGILTSLFVHAGIFHLLGNMFYLWLFGDNVEERMGRIKFLIFYFFAGTLGALVHAFFYSDSTIPLVGASGAISGVLGAYFIFFPWARIKTLFMYRVIDIPAWIYLGTWIAFQVILAVLSLALGRMFSVAFLAHIGGFLSGILISFTMKRLAPSLPLPS